MNEKVLLVDDETDFLDVLAERMRSRGFDVTTCSSATEAVTLIQKTSFDAIILDLMMPEMDGLDMLQTMKSSRPELQIILLTGHATIEKGIHAMKMGAMDFLEKPADIQKLTDKIRKAKANRMLIVEKQMESKIEEILKSKGW